MKCRVMFVVVRGLCITVFDVYNVFIGILKGPPGSVGPRGAKGNRGLAV